MESYKEAHEFLSPAIKEFDVSKTAIHPVSIRMFQARLSSTDIQAGGSPPAAQALFAKQAHEIARRKRYYWLSDPFE
jgi:hypothetical protein